MDEEEFRRQIDDGYLALNRAQYLRDLALSRQRLELESLRANYLHNESSTQAARN